MRLLAVICAAMLSLGFAANAVALTPPALKPIPKTLHQGSTGKRVKALQWLLSGHDPSAYRSIQPYRGVISGNYGSKTATAVWNMKYRLGYPIRYVNKDAGFQLFQILLGKQKRPIQWIAIGAKRQTRVQQAIHKVTACQNAVVSLAVRQVGVTEVPLGSDSGYYVHLYQSVTGQYNAPWCASFAQWVLRGANVGPIADRSASVFYIRDWAYHRGLLRSTPERGTLVLYLWSQGHMGIVVRVVQHGFYTVEGNYSNRVAQVYHPFIRSAIAFVYLPHCS